MSSAGGYSVEEVTAAASGPIFYQLFLFGGRQVAETEIERAQKAGCQSLVITVDTMAHGMRERPVRRRTPMPGTPLPIRELIRMLPRAMRHPAWVANFLSDPWARSMLRKNGVLRLPMALSPDGQPMSVTDAMIGNYVRPFVWEDFSWVREQWNGPIVIKGVLRPDDARRAVDAGASAVVVSNHGGNVYDGAPATLRVLPDILDAVGSDAEVLVDSGVRRGSDVVKALALGARAVLVGRASAYGFMAAGEDGVRRVLEVIRDELDQALAYIGSPSVRELDSSYVDARNLI